jgi:hypothetical protein
MPINDPTDLSNLALWVRARDHASLGSPADGGTPTGWNDLSGNAFHLTVGNGPTYQANSGIPYVNLDGTDDYFFRNADLGMFAAGATSAFVAVRGNPNTDRRLIAAGNSADNGPIYSPLQSGQATSNRAAAFVRGATVMFHTATTVAGDLSTTAVFNNADHVVGVVDTGTTLTLWIDGAEQSAIGSPDYVRSGTPTFNRFALGALLRAAAGSFFAGRVYEAVVYLRALNDTEAGDVSTYLAAAFAPAPVGGGRMVGAGLLEGRHLRRPSLVRGSCRSMAGWTAHRSGLLTPARRPALILPPDRRLAA